MNIQAILFMCNDFNRAKFTLENFYKWHKNIPIKVINSGGADPAPYLQHIPTTTFVNVDNLWHKKTHCGKGSFDYRFFEYLFDYGLNPFFDYTLFLETDILTNRPISIVPKFDISGPITPCNEKEKKLYEYLQIPPPFHHTCCGATIYKYSYFKTITENNNFSFFVDTFKKFPQHYYMDLIATLAARLNGLSFGHWEEISNIPGHFVNGHWHQTNYNATLIHNYKI